MRFTGSFHFLFYAINPVMVIGLLFLCRQRDPFLHKYYDSDLSWKEYISKLYRSREGDYVIT